MWLTSLFAATALARPTVVQLAAPVDLDLPGRHARPFVDGSGAWRIGFGRSGSFHSVPWTGAGVDLDAQSTHVMLGDGVDHGWVRCPDGGFLHVASVNRAALDDSAIASRLNAALTLIAQRAVVTESEALATNDMAVVCGAGFEGVAFAERGLEGEDEADQDFLYALDARFFAGETPMVYDLSASTRVTGNSLVWDDARDRLLSFGLERDLGMRVVSWGPDLQHQDSTDVEGPEPPLVGWWAQGAVPIGDHWLVVHMQGDPAAEWGLDTGDVALVLLDEGFQVVERHVLTALTPPNGAMRPSLAVQGTQLLVTFDVNGAIQLVTGQLADTDAGENDAGTGEPGDALGDSNDGEPTSADTAGPGSTGGHSGGCGCSGRNGMGVVVLLSLALGGLRRFGAADHAG